MQLYINLIASCHTGERERERETKKKCMQDLQQVGVYTGTLAPVQELFAKMGVGVCLEAGVNPVHCGISLPVSTYLGLLFIVYV